MAAPAGAQDRPAAKKLYCWNQNGARVCSDTLPPEAVNQARDEFNVKSGMRSAEVQRAMSSNARPIWPPSRRASAPTRRC